MFYWGITMDVKYDRNDRDSILDYACKAKDLKISDMLES